MAAQNAARPATAGTVNGPRNSRPGQIDTNTDKLPVDQKQAQAFPIERHDRRRVVCDHCNEPFAAARASRRFCSNACKKAAARIEAAGRSGRDLAIVDELKSLGLVAKLWPVYRTGKSPAIFGLMASTPVAVAEVNVEVDPPVTESELTGIIKRNGIFGSGSSSDFLRFRGGDDTRHRRSYGAKSQDRRKSYGPPDFGPVTGSQALENIEGKNHQMTDPRSPPDLPETGGTA